MVRIKMNIWLWVVLSFSSSFSVFFFTFFSSLQIYRYRFRNFLSFNIWCAQASPSTQCSQEIVFLSGVMMLLFRVCVILLFLRLFLKSWFEKTFSHLVCAIWFSYSDCLSILLCYAKTVSTLDSNLFAGNHNAKMWKCSIFILSFLYFLCNSF